MCASGCFSESCFREAKGMLTAHPWKNVVHYLVSGMLLPLPMQGMPRKIPRKLLTLITRGNLILSACAPSRQAETKST